MSAAEISNRHGVQPGDIFYTSWGYDQTNVDFYQVERVTAAKAEVRPIGSRVVESSTGSDRVVAAPGFTREWDVLLGINRDSEKRTKLCTTKDGYRGEPSIVLESGRHWAWKWDGASRHETAAGWGH